MERWESAGSALQGDCQAYRQPVISLLPDPGRPHPAIKHSLCPTTSHPPHFGHAFPTVHAVGSTHHRPLLYPYTPRCRSESPAEAVSAAKGREDRMGVCWDCEWYVGYQRFLAVQIM